MPPKSPEKIYSFHVANLRAVAAGFDHVLVAGRFALMSAKPHAVDSHVRLGALLLAAWAETRPMKLMFEPRAFTADERAEVGKLDAFGRWLGVVDLSFRKHYGIPRADLQEPALPSSAFNRLEVLRDALTDEIRPVITLRNKLAHGQWRYPLNEGGDEVAQAETDALRSENLLLLKQKMRLIEAICSSVHDLAVSLPTFNRDWDRHFRLVAQARTDLRTRSYQAWVDQLRVKRERGRTKRSQGSTQAP